MNSQKPSKDSDQNTRPRVFRTWYFETCFRLIELFGKEVEKDILQHLLRLEVEEANALVQYYLSRKSFDSESLRIFRVILKSNTASIDWEGLFVATIYNMPFIRYLHDNNMVLDFSAFLSEQADLSSDSKAICLFSLCNTRLI